MKGPLGNAKKEPQILGGIQRRSSEEETEWWREPQKLRASKLANTMRYRGPRDNALLLCVARLREYYCGVFIETRGTQVQPSGDGCH